MIGRRAALALALLVVGGCTQDAEGTTAGDPLLVAAAADLLPAFTELGAHFEAATGERVTFSFGSSGQLAQQVAEGAPIDVFASANAGFVDRVLAAGVGDHATRTTYAVGRIVLWSTEDRWGGWEDLGALVADPDVTTIAIANPDHAPYGFAARQAFVSEGLWEAVRPRLVFGGNVADTQRLAASGNADAAVVALSLAIASDEAGQGRWVLLDDALHEPLRQDLLVVSGDPDRAEVAARFVALIGSEEGREVMRRYGFLLPGDALPAAPAGEAAATVGDGGSPPDRDG